MRKAIMIAAVMRLCSGLDEAVPAPVPVPDEAVPPPLVDVGSIMNVTHLLTPFESSSWKHEALSKVVVGVPEHELADHICSE
jgi:hypothetical protein